MNDMMNTNGNEQYPRKRILWGITLIVAGVLFLLDRMDIYDVGDIWHFWPVMMSIAGLIEVLTARSMRDVTRGAMNIVIGMWLYACIEDVWGFNFANSWPILLIAFGINVFLNGIVERNRKS
jgi:uncharacterized membrane protein HdeD (DUF308 family)